MGDPPSDKIHLGKEDRMCCFSQPVESVSHTHIFARSAEKGRQFLVYEMKLVAKAELAMILPLPVPPKTAEDAVTFINLKDYPGLFHDMKEGFPEPPTRGDALADLGNAPKPKSLAVVEVGDFEASFVPSVADFSRLDERFRLPAAAWDALPGYKDHGFAVFKLKKGVREVHPMAFEFPRTDPKRLFFPTVHIHDGKVHATAVFDHSLYCQSREGETLQVLRWDESPKLASGFVKTAKTAGIVDADRHVHRRRISGEQKNEDTLV